MIINTITKLLKQGPTGARGLAGPSWVVVLLLGAAPAPPGAQGVQATIHGRVMGTGYRVTVAGEAVQRLEALAPGVHAALEEVDREMSTYRADSAVSRLNQADTGTWVPMPASVLDVVFLARSVSRASRGAFDVTAGPLVNLWGFGPAGGPERPPSPEAIAAARRSVSFEALEARRHPPALRKTAEGMYIDLSGIAKGYAIDQAGRFLEARGVEDYLVDVGGDIRARGCNDDGGPWKIGIETPGAGKSGIESVTGLENQAVATSGDYRNYFEYRGSRYSHVIDPGTGWPARRGVASATVVAPSAALADAYATTVLVMGSERGLALLETRGFEGMSITRTDNGFEERPTRGFHALLVSDGDGNPWPKCPGADSRLPAATP